MSILASLVCSSVLYGANTAPTLPQIGMCFGPFLLFQIGIIIALSIFLGAVAHDIALGHYRSTMDLAGAKSRAETIGLASFVLFVVLGCAILWYMLRDFYIP